MLPYRIGRDVDLKEVRAVADLARLENWEDISHAVLPRIRDKTPHHEVASRESMRHSVNKSTILTTCLGLIGLVSVVSAAVAFRRRKSSRE